MSVCQFELPNIHHNKMWNNRGMCSSGVWGPNITSPCIVSHDFPIRQVSMAVVPLVYGVLMQCESKVLPATHKRIFLQRCVDLNSNQIVLQSLQITTLLI